MNRSWIILISILVLGVVVPGCSFLSGDKEVVYAPTEVGTPVGDKVTKEIGPAGGTLSSPDGRLTLTVPKDTLTESVAFAIQPITNNAGNGLGNAYRLEPDGRTFNTPVNISFRYGDGDVEGTTPEALSIAYQDGKGAWHMQRATKLDQTAKTVTVETTHFTDFAFVARLKLSPARVSVRPGQEVVIALFECPEPVWYDPRPGPCDKPPKSGAGFSWALSGPGTLANQGAEYTTYVAPKTRGKENVATVYLTASFHFWDAEKRAMITVEKNLSAKITIVGSYQATGQTGDVKYFGVICSLEEPFTVYGTLINYEFKFLPLSPTAGSMTITADGMIGPGRFKAQGGGTYTIEGADTAKPRIAITADMSGTGTAYGRTVSASGGGTAYIDLVPIDSGECGE